MPVKRFSIPKRPVDEEKRLAAVRAFAFDYDRADPELDALVAGAAEQFSMPIVLVSIVDDTDQCFRACKGLDVRSTSRSISFCGHAVLIGETLVVPDAAADPRFTGNPLVIGEPHIRFYAGEPLITAEGHAIGTLCLIDTVPRAFGHDDRLALAALAARVLHRLEAMRPTP